MQTTVLISRLAVTLSKGKNPKFSRTSLEDVPSKDKTERVQDFPRIAPDSLPIFLPPPDTKFGVNVGGGGQSVVRIPYSPDPGCMREVNEAS